MPTRTWLCLETLLFRSHHASLVDAFTDSDLSYKVDIVDWALTSESFRSRIEALYISLQNAHAPSPQSARASER